MYNNYNNGGYNNGGGRRYTRGTNNGYSNQYQFRNQGQYQGSNYAPRPKKHSGCKKGMGKNGQPYVRGWNWSKGAGMVTFFATPYKGTSIHTSKNGVEWENWMVKIERKRERSLPELTSGLYRMDNGKVIIKDLQIVMNPATNYCGTNQRRRS